MHMSYKILILCAAALMIACTPVINQRGYLEDKEVEAGIRPGSDTKTSVQDKLGYASTTATFGGDAWYYISQTEKQVAFFTPTVQQRSILAIYFDKTGKVTGLRHYALAQGHLINPETRITVAGGGRELTFLQQLLNATPASQTGMQQTNPGGGAP
jgi:outer membrane protein assembly factor BamE (lipoprotein component of BamABCDE complex)